MDADGDVRGDAMNKEDVEFLIACSLDIERQDRELNARIRQIWKEEQPPIGSPLDNAYRRSGHNKWSLVAGELKQLREEAGG